MRTILFEGGNRRWSLSIALLAGLAVLLVSLAPSIDAQDNPRPPHWFWGNDADAYAGDVIQAVNHNGTVIQTATIANDGGWSVIVSLDDATMIKLQLVTNTVTRETGYLDVIEGGFEPEGLSIANFSTIVGPPGDGTLTVRIIARRAIDGRIEFGMRGPDGEDILPPARFFPAAGPGHSRWLRSTEIDFGNGFVGRIIARHVAADGRTEFGFRVAGYDDIFPRARFFPASGPDHNRWLRSSEIDIGQPR